MKTYCSIIIFIAVALCMVSCDVIFHPCDSNINKDCVIDYFSKNALCTVVKDAKNSVFYRENLPIYLSSIGLTVITTQTTLSQLDGDFEEFYLDKKTGNLVMTINFESKGIFCDAPESIFVIREKGREPKVFTEYVNATYPAVLTVIIPTYNGITAESLRNAHYSAYFPTSNAPINIGPKFTESEDPIVKQAYDGLIADVPTALKEIFATKASYLFLAYLQNQICDFRLNTVLQKHEMTVINNNNGIEVDETQYSKPCDGSDDFMPCIRNYFEDQGSCSAVNHPNNKPVFRGLYTNFMPAINCSVTLTKSSFTGLNGNIENFYINKQTKDLVMSIAFDGIEMESPEGHVVISERGQQPKVISDSSRVIYPVVMTAVIPVGDGLTKTALNKALVSNVFTGNVSYELGPNFSESKDPQMMAIMDFLTANPNIIGNELFATEGPYIFLTYLQKYVCDYGFPQSL